MDIELNVSALKTDVILIKKCCAETTSKKVLK
jgi:hypothetical protein